MQLSIVHNCFHFPLKNFKKHFSSNCRLLGIIKLYNLSLVKVKLKKTNNKLKFKVENLEKIKEIQT